ncbi:hypothetical protein FA15DRAFT_640025 [Coprinopsis marcescibilis]|uniref:NACHT domain-containing protein n=1 Tax=Coprinopsis marcescibilis TaxID=230819 RepID=A0A5C3KZ45_COPMA|nr:hypothetical protein FA15DRAFT_640025 [Coprinopsis marcescibilis]
MSFQGASGFSVADSQFNHVKGDQTIINNYVHSGQTINNIQAIQVDGISKLYKSVAVRALYDAMERSNAPRCMEGTRVKLQEDFLGWLDGSHPSSSETDRFWMTGAAGSGKSSIAQSVAEACAEKGILAATFFFSFRSQETNNYTRFIPTIAYQMALSIPSATEFIATAMAKDLAVVKRSLKAQLDALIIQPLAQARQKNPGELWPHVIIIDGLDEVKDEEQQATILSILHECVKTPQFPFRILIASRPEPKMRKYFLGAGKSRTHFVDINEDYDVEPDLDIFFGVSFALIREENLIQDEWPAKQDITELISRASGQFAYASTVVEYVKDKSRQPKQRLREVLGIQSDTTQEHPLSPLYALYDSIVRKCPDPKESALTILIIEEDSLSDNSSAAAYNAFLGCTMDAWARIFDNLHSLLFIPQYDDSKSEYKIRHKSLIDFFQSEEHAKDLYISQATVSASLSIRFLRMFESFSFVSSRTNANPGLLESLPLNDNGFALDLFYSDRRNLVLAQLLLSTEVLSCIHADKDSDVPWEDLNWLWVSVHNRDLGCSFLKCGPICRRWRKGLLQSVRDGVASNSVTYSRLAYMLKWTRLPYRFTELSVDSDADYSDRVSFYGPPFRPKPASSP